MELEEPEEGQVVPTFYLGGQPYIFDTAIRDGGEEIIRAAFEETRRHTLLLFRCFHGKLPMPGETAVLSRSEFEHRRIELVAGMWRLRDLIPTDEILLPNASFVVVH